MRDPNTAPSCELFAEIEIDLGPPISCGISAKGERRIVPILGGRFSGPYAAGLVLPGGSDWQMVLSSEVMELDARYVLQTDDGEHIAVHNGPSFRYGRPNTIRGLLDGRQVDPKSYYSCGNPQFDTGIERLKWINYHRFVGKSVRLPTSTLIKVYRVDDPMET